MILRVFLILLVLLIEQNAFASDAKSKSKTIDELLNMNIKDLANVKIVSVSKREENAAKAASAIFVINSEDIRRFGARSIPDTLRFVPGLQVSQTSSSRWRVSIRGFNEAFTNKLLVLVDGRSVYTPLFSGVYWDSVNVPLETIQRIEVIRGSAGSTYGANAVNGVINIITKKSETTKGYKIETGIGSKGGYQNYVRYGGKLANNVDYRIYAEQKKEAETKNNHNIGIGDDWQVTQTGFRADYRKNSDKVSITSDIYNGVKQGNFILPILSSPYVAKINRDEEINGGNILLNFDHYHDNGTQSIVKTYFDYNRRNHITLDQKISSFDFDYQYNIDLNSKNQLTSGLEYRRIIYDLSENIYNLYPNSSNSIDDNISSFIQNKSELIDGKLFLTLGTKLEYNEPNKFALQPNARLALSLDKNNTIWTSINRSVRTPGKAEQDVRLVIGNLKPGFATWNGNKNLKNEELISFETGYKTLINDNISFDFTGFVNKYDNLRTFQRHGDFIDSSISGFPVFKNRPYYAENKGYGIIRGFEAASNIRLKNNWMIMANYSLLDMNIKKDSDSNDISLLPANGSSPKNMFNITNRVDISENIDFDISLNYVDELSAIKIPSYTNFTTRVEWRPVKNLAISLLGSNLLDNYHAETSAPQFGEQSLIGRTVFLKLNYSF